MNGTMFFDSISTQDKKGTRKNKKDKGDLKISDNKLEIKDEIVAHTELSFKITKNDRKERKHNLELYKPISPSIEEDMPQFDFRNSPSPGQDVLKFTPGTTFTHINNQALMFEKYSLSSDIFSNANFHQPSNINMHFSYNNNYRNNNNNNNVNYNNNNDGHYSKNRSNQQNNHSNSNHREQRKRHLNNYYRTSNDPMIRRAHGLSHRFRSRSDILKIDPSPSQLLNGGPYDDLSEAIYDVFTSKSQKPETYEDKIQIWKELFLYIRRCLTHYALYIVGSTMTGFGLNSSDIDMCLLIRPCTEDPRLDSLNQLHHIKNHLLKYGFIVHSELIMAKVPILKFREQSRGFEVDLNCNNSVGIYNTHLLYCYARCDWRVRPLVIMIKIWAQANGINDAKNLTVSSYSWTLMVIHYLQCGVSPTVVPCLHTLYPDHFNAVTSKITDVHEDLSSLDEFQSFNTQSLAELLIGFYGYYSDFDFNQFAISVRAGGRLLIEDCKQVKAPKNDHNQWKYLCIEEPFDFTNTARSVYDIAAFRHIKNIITKSYEELVRTKMLNSVLPVGLGPDPTISVSTVIMY
ncbi:unnamed protein product [Ceutorhynchus assimilis]|uniref:Uncharacterized protein n=1 Tax=Ceutorhynchus assimilis TaxID=467358 RepID=A0A9N9MVX2_9CUCU|nr:unnamed protein product [Ceutorhynchus assimilis]